MSDDNDLKDIIDPDDADNSIFQDTIDEIIIPDNPTLNDLVKLSLKTFKTQMEDIQLMEPRFKSRALEVSRQYLELAQNTLVKIEELNHAKNKIEIEREVKLKRKVGEEKDADIKMSREEMIKLIKDLMK